MDQRVTAMHPDWLQCYAARRHDFRWRGATVQKGQHCDCHRRTEKVTRICQLCPVERVDIIDPRTLAELHRSYTRVEGYHAKKGESRLDSTDIRRELIRRVRANDWEDPA